MELAMQNIFRKSKLSNFVNLNIAPKLVIILIIFGLIPAASLFIVFEYSKKNFEAITRQPFLESAFSIGETIDRNLFERYGDVQAFGLNTAVYDPANWRNPSNENPLIGAMNGYMTGYGIYKLMLLLDTKGQVLAVNSVDTQGKSLPTKILYSQDFSDMGWFKQALRGDFLKGTKGLTGTAVGKPDWNQTIAEIYGSDGFVIPFSAPVKNRSGETIGVWVNFADFGLIEEIFTEFYEHFVDKGMKSAELTLLDAEGRILVDYDPVGQSWSEYRRDPNVVGKLNLSTMGVEAASRAVKGESGSLDAFHARKKVWQASGFAHTDGAYDYPGLGWSVLVRVPVDEAYASVNEIERTQIIAIAIAALLILAIGYPLGKLASAPLRGMTVAMAKLAEGDTSIEVPAVHRTDEIGAMASAVQVFKENAIERERLRAESEKEQTSRLQRQRKIEALITGFREHAQNLLRTVSSNTEEMEATARSLSATASRTTTQASSVAAAAEQASSNVQAVAAASEQLSASINEIAGQISQATSEVRGATHAATETDKKVSNLAQSAQKIGSVVALIQDIAAQTNLLALNATIEAARAGEAGKGFAVVASEVKELATQTGDATKEIRTQIESIQIETSSAVDGIRGIATAMQSISDSTQAIAAAVAEQGASTTEISGNVQQVAAGTNEVAQNIVGVNSAADENLASAKTMLTAAQDVARRTSELQNVVGEFLDNVAAA
jgi:methyl-accepting chemotaxis protein